MDESVIGMSVRSTILNEVAKGTLKNILVMADITLEEFLKRL